MPTFEGGEWIVGAVVFVVFVVVICGSVVKGIVNAVNSLTSESGRLRIVEDHERKENFESLLENDGWAVEHGFEFLGTYFMNAVAPLYMAVWRNAESTTFLCLYRMSTQAVTLSVREFVTMLPKDHSLTTSSARDAFTLPFRSGSFMQTFPKLSMDQLWERHMEGIMHVVRKTGIQPIMPEVPFVEIFNGSVVGQVAYVRSLSLWPLRALYWYFVKRWVMRNRSIEDQHPG